jgi:hypothetical protein
VRLIAALVLAALAAAADAQTPFRFAAFGDVPYFAFEMPAVRRLFNEMMEQDVAFAVHVGDIKSGATPCADDVLVERRGLLDAAPVPLVFVPGDNEWTDCHRELAGGFHPRERLDRVRALFFDSDKSLGQRKLRLTRQSEQPRFRSYRENVRWVAGQVLFVTLNIPGSNNNFGRNEKMDAEHAERMSANFAWLNDAIKRARAPTIRGIAIFVHGDPHFDGSRRRNDGYARFRDAIRAHAMTFPKPMLFVHGDGHSFAVDQPLRNPRTQAPLAHFTRVEVFGSPNVNWVRIDVAGPGAPLFSVAVGAGVTQPLDAPQ